MPYHSYAKATREHIFELFRSFTEKEAESLSEQLTLLDESGWYDWLSKNLKEVFAYLEATPSERKKKKKWQHPEIALLLKYSAYIEANKAYSLLYAVGVHSLPIGVSYREMTKAALNAYYYTTVQHFPKWPFDTPAPLWMVDPHAHYGDDQLSW